MFYETSNGNYVIKATVGGDNSFDVKGIYDGGNTVPAQSTSSSTTTTTTTTTTVITGGNTAPLLSTITDLLEGTPERVYEACRRCHDTCGEHFIVGAGCEISPLTPPENLRAMIAYARDHRPGDYTRK